MQVLLQPVRADIQDIAYPMQQAYPMAIVGPFSSQPWIFCYILQKRPESPSWDPTFWPFGSTAYSQGYALLLLNHMGPTLWITSKYSLTIYGCTPTPYAPQRFETRVSSVVRRT